MFVITSRIHWKTDKDLKLFIIKSIKREIQTRLIHDCRYDERLEGKVDESTCLAYTGLFLSTMLTVYLQQNKKRAINFVYY